MCVCEYVRERERERERERDGEKDRKRERARQRENETGRRRKQVEFVCESVRDLEFPRGRRFIQRSEYPSATHPVVGKSDSGCRFGEC